MLSYTILITMIITAICALMVFKPKRGASDVRRNIKKEIEESNRN